MTLPTTRIEIAFATLPDDPSPVWTDVTSSARLPVGTNATHGRQDQYESAQPARFSVTLMNPDGRYTPGNTGSPYYPNVKKGRKIRWSETLNGVTYYRFTGYIDEWPIQWDDATGNMADVLITATGRTARMGHGKALPSVMEVEQLLDAPDAYYTLGEDAGSTQAGNSAVVVQPPMSVVPFGGGSTANSSFGTPGPGVVGALTAALFTRVSATAGAYLQAALNGFTSGADPSYQLEAWFQSSGVQAMGIAQLDDGSGSLYFQLNTDASGKLVGKYLSPGGGTYTITSAATVTDGQWHHVALRHTTGGGNSVATLFLDGASVGTATITSSQFNHTRLTVGGGINGTSAYAGAVAHVAAYTGAAISDTRVQQHYLAGSTGFAGERSDQRIQRLAGYAGVATADLVTETGLSTSVAAQDTTGQQPITLMQDVTATEGGVLFDGGDGRLVFQARSHRYNAASSLTLLVSRREIMPSLTPRLDDQDLVNDVTATRAGGVSARVVDTASVAEYGTYRSEIQLLTTSDNEVFDAASWKVYTASTPQVRVPTAEVELANLTDAQIAVLLSREVGDRITLGGLPVQAPSSTMDFFIEGWNEVKADFTYRVILNLSSANLSGVWQLDSPTYSVLGATTRLAY